MTKKELNMILKLINLHTTTREVGYYRTETKQINENGINALKKDIKELFEEGENNNGE